MRRLDQLCFLERKRPTWRSCNTKFVGADASKDKGEVFFFKSLNALPMSSGLGFPL